VRIVFHTVETDPKAGQFADRFTCHRSLHK
jgi:hypothetical protein